MQVFFSFCGDDREIKDEIVASLRASLDEGDTVWESDLGCASDFSEECIREIKRSQVYIILVSDASMNINYTVNEAITARKCEARGELNMVVYKITTKPYPDNLELQLNHISDANFVSRLRNDDTGVAMLIAKVKRLLTLRKNGTPEKPCEVEFPEINGIPLGSSGFFVEGSRDDLILNFKECIDRSNVVFLSHISGYGRKSMLRKYMELHKGDFDKVLSIRSFKGTVREFFLYGLEITNLNRSVFENMNEEQIAVKKCELLSRLGKRTAIVVPHLICDDGAPDYLYDLLENIGCQIIFVTPGISRTIRDRFPVIDVGSMSHEALDEIFFHYYNKAQRYEENDLKDYLHNFYEYIGGHTQSVELTASVLSSEIDVFPEDIPDVLNRWMNKEEDRLSARISALLSGLMNLSEVSENEKNILLATAIAAQVPMNITEYMELLDICGISDQDDVRRLAENGWIVFRTSERTVQIEPFIADACIRNISKNQEIIFTVLRYYVEKCVEYASSVSFVAYTNIIRKLKYIFSAAGLRHAETVMDVFLTDVLVNSNYNEQDFEDYQAQINEARKEVALMFGQGNTEETDELFDFIENNAKVLSTIYDQENRDGILSSVDMLRNLILDDEGLVGSLIALSQCFEENELVNTVMKTLDGDAASNPQAIFNVFIRLSEIVGQMDQEDEDFDFFAYFVQFSGALLINNFSALYQNNDYLLMRLCQSYIKFIETVVGIQAYESVSSVYLVYFFCLLRMDIYNKETYSVFADWVALYLMTLQQDNTAEVVNRKIVSIAAQYAETLALNNQCRAAETIYHEYMEAYPVPMDREMTKHFIRAADAIIHGYINSADTQSAMQMINCLIRFIPKSSLKQLSEDSEEFIAYQNILNLNDILNHPETDAGFDEGNYLNYYQTYASDRKDQKKTLRYMAIAKRAARIDYSSLSEEELKENTEALKKRAKQEGILSIEAEAFAMVSEAGKRALGYKHHIVQYIGAAAILDGNIAEIQNGEGKTYTIILAAYVYALTGKQTHIVDTSGYLTFRNFMWMRDTLRILGITTAIVDHKLSEREAEIITQRDVIYENIYYAIYYRLQKDFVPYSAGFRYDVAIVDEADLLMIEKGYTPMCILSNDDGNKAPWRNAINPHDVYDFVVDMQDDRSALYSEDRYKNISIKAEAYEIYEAYYGVPLKEYTDELFRLEKLMSVCIKCLFDYRENDDYFIQKDTLYIENRNTGEFKPLDNTYDFFLRKKHGLPVKDLPSVQISEAEMSCNEYLKGFAKVTGTTATAVSLRKDFKDLFDLEVVQIPPNIPITRMDYPPMIYLTKRAKYAEILSLTEECYADRQPVLIVTGSVPESERISRMLTEHQIENVLLNARNSDEKAEMLAQAGRIGRVTVTTAVANRGVDILPGGNPRYLARDTLLRAGADIKDLNTVMFYESGNDGRLRELRKRFTLMTAVHKIKCDKEREEIEKLGGLCVIGTECFTDLRAEQQLRGRTGRQGFCGESHIFYSLEDDFFEEHRLGYLKSLLIDKMHLDEDTELDSQMLNNVLYNLRQKISFQRSRSLNNDKHVLYYKEVRDRLIEITRGLETGKTDLYQLFREYFASSPRTLKTVMLGKEDLESYRYGEKRGFWDWFFAHVEENEISRRRIPDLVMKKVGVLLARFADIKSTYKILGVRFYSQLKIYYQKLDAEMTVISNRTDDLKRQRSFVQKSNKTFYNLIVELALIDYLNILFNLCDVDNELEKTTIF